MLRNSPSYLFTELPLCKETLDSLEFWIPCRGFRIPCKGFESSSLELGFWILVVNGIPDSLSCIPGSKARDSGFHKQKISAFSYIGRSERIKKITVN